MTDLNDDEIVELAREIKELEGRLSRYIQQYEAKFTAMDLGVRSWMVLGDGLASIGYDKINGKLGLYWRKDNNSEAVPLDKTHLGERYGAARKLQELEVNHIKHAKKYAKNVKKFLSGGYNNVNEPSSSIIYDDDSEEKQT